MLGLNRGLQRARLSHPPRKNETRNLVRAKLIGQLIDQRVGSSRTLYFLRPGRAHGPYTRRT